MKSTNKTTGKNFPEEVFAGISHQEMDQLQQKVRDLKHIVFQTKKNADIVRRFLLSQVDDVRVLYIRIAKRIALLQEIKRNPNKYNSNKKNRYIDGAMYIAVPLLAQLGVYTLKKQLEDLCFELQNPLEYTKLKEQIEKKKSLRKAHISTIQHEVKQILTQKKIPVIEIKGRDKGMYSLWKKIQKKNYFSLEEVNDVLALRIIVPTVEDCYGVLSILHSQKKISEEHFIDYISSPKPNGYKSIHTTLRGFNNNSPVEIQIRTPQMNHDAEIGIAAHWKYKEETSLGKNIEVSGDHESGHIDRFAFLKEQLQQDPKIYPITPTGEIKELPKNSTPIDFAYSIHSDIGDKCSGALVNEKIFPISGTLQTGDMVELFTSQQQSPKPEWLKFVVSKSARHKIQIFLNRKGIPFISRAEINKTEEIRGEKNERNKEKRQEKKAEGVLKKIKKTFKKYLSPSPQEKTQLQKEKKEHSLTIGGEQNIPHHFAKCCHPEESDNVVAYSSSTRDFVIHTPTCHNVQNLDPNRLMEAKFV